MYFLSKPEGLWQSPRDSPQAEKEWFSPVPQWQTIRMNAKPPFPKSWWVQEGVLLAGCYPGDSRSATARQKLSALLAAGVRVFLSLQEPGEQTPRGPFIPYRPMLEQLARDAGVDIEFANFPISDNDVPSIDVMAAILAKIRSAHAAGQCVYVHCWGGHGRTGTVVGCWLREQGLTGQQALERIVQLRRHDPYLESMFSPQTTAQRRMILAWQPSSERFRNPNSPNK